MNHLTDEELVDLFYNELYNEGAPLCRAHIDRCAECRAKLERLSGELASLPLIPVPERHDNYGREVWARVRPALEKQPGPKRRRAWLRARLRPWMLAPALAAVLAIAFVAGAWTEQQRTAAQAKTRERVLLIAMSDHLQRSEAVLTELLERPAGSIDLGGEREQARNLLDENRLLRQTALHLGDRPHAALLDDLERTLLDLAHAPADTSPEDLRLLRQRVERDRLLPKLRLTSASAREKGQTL